MRVFKNSPLPFSPRSSFISHDMQLPLTANDKNRSKQTGAVVLLMVFLITLGAMSYLAPALNANRVKIQRDQQTDKALAEAKAALIGYAVSHASKPGTLPCTDTGNNGSASNSGENCHQYIGRLPWKRLGIGDIRDGSGECLWYALSPVFRDTISTDNRGSAQPPLNSTTAGSITINNNGTALATPVVAVVFAPGAALNGQDRSNIGSTTCGGNSTIANYLDTVNAIDNATGNVAGSNYTFASSNASGTFNDRLIYITANELFVGLRPRMVKAMLGNITPQAGPARYFDLNGIYPHPAATPAGHTDPTKTAGFINNSSDFIAPGVGLQYSALGAWLNNNHWFDLANYSYMSATHVKLTIDDALGSYSCDANANIFTCASL